MTEAWLFIWFLRALKILEERQEIVQPLLDLAGVAGATQRKGKPPHGHIAGTMAGDRIAAVDLAPDLFEGKGAAGTLGDQGEVRRWPLEGRDHGTVALAFDTMAALTVNAVGQGAAADLLGAVLILRPQSQSRAEDRQRNANHTGAAQDQARMKRGAA